MNVWYCVDLPCPFQMTFVPTSDSVMVSLSDCDSQTQASFCPCLRRQLLRSDCLTDFAFFRTNEANNFSERAMTESS